jgi:hypothetical protein
MYDLSSRPYVGGPRYCEAIRHNIDVKARVAHEWVVILGHLRDANCSALRALHFDFKTVAGRHPANILSDLDSPSPRFSALSKLPSAKSASFRRGCLSIGDA